MELSKIALLPKSDLVRVRVKGKIKRMLLETLLCNTAFPSKDNLAYKL